MDEHRLVRSIIKGDDRAFDALHQRTRRRLERVAAGFLGDPDLVQDVVQEAYARALPQLKKFRFESSLNTWLTRFVINLSLQALRHRKKMLSTDTNDIEALLKPASTGLSPDQSRSLSEAIASLDRLSRRILLAKDVEGMTFVELGRRLKMPPGTLMSRLARARLKLREILRSRDHLFQRLLEERP